MPARPILDDLKAVQFTLDQRAREELDALARIERSNKSAVIRRLISKAHAASFGPTLHQSEELPRVNERPADISA